MSRPLIGVTTSEVSLESRAEPLPEGEPPQREMALGMVYMRAVEPAGGIPVVLPPLGHDAIAPLLDRLCGVRLSARPDIDPHGYREGPHPRLGPTKPDLDASELAVAQLADARGTPLVGIFPGAQRRAQGDALPACPGPHGGLDRAPPGRPHQGVDAPHAHGLGQDMRAVAWAPDGIVEAIEDDGAAQYLGVQWHAESQVERAEHLALFRALGEESDRFGDRDVTASAA